MNSMEQLERLIDSLPTLARDIENVEAFWGRIEGMRQLVWCAVTNEAERAEVTHRWEDLRVMASGWAGSIPTRNS